MAPDAPRAPGLDRLVEHLFRRDSGRLVARLLRVLGPSHFDLAEEAVQDAMVQALRIWPFRGVPEEPTAWLSRVARNRALDVLRRRSSFETKRPELVSLAAARLERLPDAAYADEIDDDQLRLIFTCCHPEIPGDARIALTLKTVCGFSVAEIGRAFLAREATVAQRLVRAKRRITSGSLPYAVPEPHELPARLASVLKVVYLLFNEGYTPGDREVAIRADVCREAVRLACRLAEHPVAGRSETHALAALLLFQSARLPARTDEAGELVRLEEQDRSRWDRGWIAQAFAHLSRSTSASSLTPYHLEAGIAACHAGAASWDETDWPAILAHYDRLLALAPSPVTELNRAVALAHAEGSEAGLRALEPLRDRPELVRYALLPATRGELLLRLGREREAAGELQRARDLAASASVRRLLERRLAALPRP